MILTDEILKWIEDNLHEDVAKLRLKLHKQMTPELDFALLQIECRKKTAKKLPVTLQCNKFIFPTTLSSEQCTSDLLAIFHSTLIENGQTLIDLTSGLGIDVYHFASKAKSVTAIEKSPVISEAIKHNAAALALNNITSINDDCIEFIKQCSEHYDVAFIDPARRGKDGRRLYALGDCEPDVSKMLSDLKRLCNRLIVKASPMLDITRTLIELPEASDIYTVGTVQECKELVIVIDFSKETRQINRHAVTLSSNGYNCYSFNETDESMSMPQYELPQINSYIYEPYPSVMKAAPYKLLSSSFNIAKLHVNTHLYTSAFINHEFPGEIFRIEDIIEFSSKKIKGFSTKYPQINIATRNFIIGSDELRKKLKVKDGGTLRAIGCTAADDSKLLLILSKV